MTISNEQLAELIVGFAKSQNAIIEAMVQKLGKDDGLLFRGRTVIPILQDYANIRNHEAKPTLTDLPSRVLLQLQGSHAGGGNTLQEWLGKELARITA